MKTKTCPRRKEKDPRSGKSPKVQRDGTAIPNDEEWLKDRDQ